MSIDLLLVRPPERGGVHARLVVPPIGLLYVAGAARRAGWRVAVIDCAAEGIGLSELVRRVRGLRPEVLGLSAMTPMLPGIQAAAARLADHVGHIVLGGVHATRFREQALADVPEVDHLVVGEGENVIGELLSWLAGGLAGETPAGVLSRGRAGLREASLPDVEQLALPARDLVPNEAYRYLFQTRPGLTTAISSRGCPFSCSFCDKTISGSSYRSRSAASVVAEMEEVEHRYKLGYIVFFDDNFTLSARRVREICHEILRRGLSIQWKCEARVDGLDAPLARLMYRAGCRTVAFGVESGNQSSLDTLKKGSSVRDAALALAAARAAGLETVAYVLLGIPGESPADAQATLHFCRDNRVDFVQFSTLSPFPGTELYDQAMERGWYRMTSVRNPADAEEQRATLLAPGWDEPSLARTLRQVYAGFYLRPGYLAHQVARAARHGALAHRARLGLSMARWLVTDAVGGPAVPAPATPA